MAGNMISFGAKLGRLAAAQPDAPAVTCGDECRTYAELDRRSNRIARSLAVRGVAPGDLVTLSLPNSIAFVEVAWAIWKLGATPQPISFRLPKAELDPIAELAGTPLIIGEPLYAPDRPCLSVEHLLADGLDDGALPDVTAPVLKAPTSGGSTGRPKLILSTAPALAPEGDAPIGPWGIWRDDVVLVPAPLYHNAGFMMMYAAIGTGAHLVLAPRFDAAGTLELIARHRASWVYLVPTMMSRIWRLPSAAREAAAIGSVRALWHLAAPCPIWLKEAFIGWFGPDKIFELYSGTEAQARAMITGCEWLEHRGSVGRVWMGEMRAFDAQGREVATGEVGEIYMRPGPAAAATYCYRGALAKSLPGGWESLGDLGRFDADGYLYLADRLTDMVLVGGSNVYPAEIEGALEAHAEVQSCAIIGLPDEDLGNRVHAIVQLRTPVAEQALRDHLAARLAPYKLPRTYEFVSETLRDDAGKIRRTALREARLGAGHAR